MTIRNVLVSHSALESAFNSGSDVGLESRRSGTPRKLVEEIEKELIRLQGRGASARDMSTLSEVLTVLEDSKRDPGIMLAVEHPETSLLQSYLAERAVEAQPTHAGGLEAKFDEHDIVGWVSSFFTWWRRISKHEWLPPPATPERMNNSVEVAVLGDWGTGLYGAPICSQSIQASGRQYGLILHLGDVYYSGTEREVTERFLEIWPNVPNSVSRALNSNHEMYTGGHAYFKLSLDRFGQSSSCFACQNDYWLLVGLDSAYHEHDLAMNQGEWLEGLVGAAGKRKVVLFSHHQPFSLLEKQGTKLVEKLGSLLEDRRIFAWYWGHEHRCVIYDRHPIWELHGRCIGHSGYPYFRVTPPDAELAKQEHGFDWYRLRYRNVIPGGLLLDGPNAYIEGEEDRYGPNGYASLNFNKDQLVEQIHAADGTVIFQQELA